MVLPVHQAKSSVKSPMPAFAASSFAPGLWPQGRSPVQAAPTGVALWRRHYYVPLFWAAAPGAQTRKGWRRAAGLRLLCPFAVHTTSPDSPTAFSGIVRSECIYVDGKHESPQFQRLRACSGKSARLGGKKAMRIARRFTEAAKSPYDAVPFRHRRREIRK